MSCTGPLDFTYLSTLSGVRVKSDVKVKKDSGIIFADENDTTGTHVVTNKEFVDIRNIIVTPKTNASGGSAASLIAIFDFVDAPIDPRAPAEFDIYVFDENGDRESATVGWQLEGI